MTYTRTTTYSSRRTPVRATLFRPTPVDGLTLAQKPQELPPSRLIRPIRLRFMWEHWVRSSKAWIAARTGKPSTPGKKKMNFFRRLPSIHGHPRRFIQEQTEAFTKVWMAVCHGASCQMDSTSMPSKHWQSTQIRHSHFTWGHTMGSTAPQTGARTGAWSVMGKPFMGLLASRSALRVFAPVLHVPHRMISRTISKKDQLWFHLRKHIG